ncbi:MAG TPA: chalcone isomerase family protein [Casimicrobiaceae bacterium]|nr:chalcone isomerase family protein [Casimicrobiaceae bacterium]
MKRSIGRCIAAGLALAAASALAMQVAGVTLDDKASVGGKELVLNGAGLRTRAIFKVYVAGLYLPAKTADAQAALAASARRIELHLLRNLSADQLLDALDDGLKENNSEAELAAIKPQVTQLASIMRAFKQVKEGDVVGLEYVDGTTRVLLGSEARGTIAGEPFNRALMKVWLGEHPVQSDLKKALLGG